MNKRQKRPGLLYVIFKTYLRFIHDKIYYKKTYSIDSQNIPANGTPTLIVSNHQNCLNDPLGILFSFRDRKPNFIARADVFTVHPLANKFLRSIGLLPAFRLNYEGEAALGKNDETFKISEQELVNGQTVIMYPEAGHQNKRWLGDFSMGYLKLAFEAAQLDNFNTEIFVLPSCNHYSNYFNMQEQFMVKFGTPISLKPYYELFKTKPRTAQRQVNALVREQIENLMLNITDLDNYNTIDFIRNTYGNKYALDNGFNPHILPQKLISDKQLCSKLEEVKNLSGEKLQKIYDCANEIRQIEISENIGDHSIEKAKEGKIVESIVARSIIAVLFIGLYIVSLWPHIIIYCLPKLIMRKISDKMFTSSFMFGVSALVTIPIFYTLSFFMVYWLSDSWLNAILYLCCLPLLALVAWYYSKSAKILFKDFRTYRFLKTKGGKDLKEQRDSLWSELDLILKTK